MTSQAKPKQGPEESMLSEATDLHKFNGDPVLTCPTVTDRAAPTPIWDQLLGDSGIIPGFLAKLLSFEPLTWEQAQKLATEGRSEQKV